MSSRPTVNIGTRVGVEPTPGAGAPANLKIEAGTFTVQPDITTAEHRVRGRKLLTGTFVTGEQSTVEFSDGRPCYSALTWLLAASIGNETVTTLEAPTETTPGVYLHRFVLADGPAESRATLAIEQGDSASVARVKHAVFSELTLKWNRNKGSFEASGKGFGGLFEHGVEPTEAPATVVSTDPILPVHVDVILSGAHLTDAPEVEISISDLLAPRSYLNASTPSFSEVIETAPKATVSLVVNDGDVAESRLTALRGRNTPVALVINADGPQLAGGVPARLTIYGQVLVTDIKEIGDKDDVWGADLGLAFASSAPLVVELVNTIAPVTPGVVAEVE